MEPAGPPLPSAPDPEANAHRDLLGGEPWRSIPAYAHVSAEEFASYRWQSSHSVREGQLRRIVGDLVSPAFLADVDAGMAIAPMAVRLTPYVVSLIDWANAERDPIRRQFLPLASEARPDHPALVDDPLGETRDSPVPGLVHRYRDRVLLLALGTCPVYCRYCTRAYAVGPEIPGASLVKLDLGTGRESWALRLDYIEAHPELEDVVISGGDTYNLSAARLTELGDRLLAIPHVRRLRFATKGPVVLPQRLLGDDPWLAALVGVVERGRAMGKQVALHTHFNHPREITETTRQAMARLFSAGVVTRNQSVLLRGVNDDPTTMKTLVRRLAHVNVEPYYVFLPDMIPGLEGLRVTVQAASALEKHVRGDVAGFNTPAFVVDTIGGGGKRDVHSHELYDRQHGIAVYHAPAVAPGRAFYYLDPLDSLPPEGRRRWSEPGQPRAILDEVLSRVSQAKWGGR
jgi:lysine 2,3-aminomutase